MYLLELKWSTGGAKIALSAFLEHCTKSKLLKLLQMIDDSDNSFCKKIYLQAAIIDKITAADTEKEKERYIKMLSWLDGKLYIAA